MNKINSNNKETALAKEKQKTVLKRYLMIAITVAIVCVAMVPVEVGMSFQSHDPSQRSQGFLCLAGGLIIVFAKSILTAIAPGVFS